MNTGFFIELPVAGYSAVLPDIGKFGAKIGAAIRQILDRIVADDRRFKGALEQFNSEIWQQARGNRRKRVSSSLHIIHRKY